MLLVYNVFHRQSKDKLIASLKEGGAAGGSKQGLGADSAVLMSELESTRQERDIFHEELRSSQHTIENLRSELAVSCCFTSILFQFSIP